MDYCNCHLTGLYQHSLWHLLIYFYTQQPESLCKTQMWACHFRVKIKLLPGLPDPTSPIPNCTQWASMGSSSPFSLLTACAKLLVCFPSHKASSSFLLWRSLPQRILSQPSWMGQVPTQVTKHCTLLVLNIRLNISLRLVCDYMIAIPN
jgi:hypothetical protein